jgi:hypothetical protein
MSFYLRDISHTLVDKKENARTLTPSEKKMCRKTHLTRMSMKLSLACLSVVVIALIKHSFFLYGAHNFFFSLQKNETKYANLLLENLSPRQRERKSAFIPLLSIVLLTF